MTGAVRSRSGHIISIRQRSPLERQFFCFPLAATAVPEPWTDPAKLFETRLALLECPKTRFEMSFTEQLEAATTPGPGRKIPGAVVIAADASGD